MATMVAASIWANPDESAYIKDYKGTEVGLEAICDLLNNLPLILDDSSKKNRKIEDNFEGLVYDLCSGKGKTRSNKELGLNRENHWKNLNKWGTAPELICNPGRCNQPYPGA